MASITIRNVDDGLKARLRVRAGKNRHSLAEEVRYILRDVLNTDHPQTLAELALEIFGPEHGVDLEPHPTVGPREPPRFDERS